MEEGWAITVFTEGRELSLVVVWEHDAVRLVTYALIFAHTAKSPVDSKDVSSWLASILDGLLQLFKLMLFKFSNLFVKLQGYSSLIVK